MVHTIKGFGIVNKAEVDIFLEQNMQDNPRQKTEKDTRKVMTRDKPEDTEGPEELIGTGTLKSASRMSMSHII